MRERSTSKDSLDLDVIIIGYNSAATLADCIRSAKDACVHLRDSLGLRARLVYVDSPYSTDGSRDIAADLGIATMVDHPGYRTPSNARMAGFLLTSAPYVMFVDSDCLLKREWLEHGMQFMLQNPQAGAVAGICTVARKLGNRSVQIVHNAGLMEPEAIHKHYTGSGSLLASRAAVTLAGGYEPLLAPLDDVYLICKLKECGREVFIIPEPMETHLNMHLGSGASGLRKLHYIAFANAPRLAALVHRSLLRERTWRYLFPFIRFELAHGILMIFSALLLVWAILVPEMRALIFGFLGISLLLYVVYHVRRKRNLFFGLASLVTMSIYAVSIGFTLLTGWPRLDWGAQHSSEYIGRLEELNHSAGN